MPESLVLELQRLAQSSATPTSELLRRAKTLAVKLDLHDALAWIECELNGYPLEAEVPSYRVIPSELYVKNPVHGWNAVAWGGDGGDGSLQQHFATSEIRQKIAEVEVVAGADRDDRPHANLNESEMKVLLSIDPRTFSRLPSARFFAQSSFIGIVEGARTKILDWTLALEKQGVMGDGMSFDAREKRKAAKVAMRISDISLNILFLSANPDPASPLSVEQEQNRIVKIRDASKHQTRIRIEALPDLDFPAFAKSLRLHAPAIVHFSGHGGTNGSLYMRDENGRAFEMQPKGVANLVLLQKASIRLVVLNACYSSMLAELLAAEIDCVIGMNDAVSDAAAILFTQVFYGALLDGESVNVSFVTGVAAVEARYPDEDQIPQLRLKEGVDAIALRLVE